MDTTNTPKILLALLLFACVYVASIAPFFRDEMLERSFTAIAKIDKEGSFDRKDKQFNLFVKLQVSKQDLFIFNEAVPEMRKQFYIDVKTRRGELQPNEDAFLAALFKDQLSRENIRVSDVMVEVIQIH